MKAKRFRTAAPFLLILLFLLLRLSAPAQSTSRVVINEFMPWSGCATNSEFIELMNFGPGPVDIGCYIVTNGQYAVTIPPNTVLQPGQFYVLAGQDVLPAGCANTKDVKVDLNWNRCGCLDKPITAADGLMADGGGVNEKVVLLDPNLKIIDAVTRNSPVSSSISLTTKSTTCASKTFDLNTLPGLTYETLGMSTGKANSFARRLDGDCGWLKTTQQSAGTTNNSSGSTASVTYSMTILEYRDCSTSTTTPGNAGSVEIAVSDATVFPMNYTLAYDVNKNQLWELSDSYTYGTDNTPSTIPVTNLAAGDYRVTVASAAGCNLKTFPFTILPCNSALLALKLLSFKKINTGGDQYIFQWVFEEAERVRQMTLEKSTGNGLFAPATTVAATGSGTQTFTARVAADALYPLYRLRIVSKDGSVVYSPVVYAGTAAATDNKLWPNPAKGSVQVSIASAHAQKAEYKIFGLQQLQYTGSLQLLPGTNQLSLPVSGLAAGVYQLLVQPSDPGAQPISFRFVIKP